MTPMQPAAAAPPPARAPLGERSRALTRRLAFVAAFALAGTALLWVAAISEIRTERMREIRFAYRESANLALALEEHVRRTLRHADQFALGAKRFQERSGGDADWKQLMEQIGSDKEAVLLISVADEHGNIVRANRTFTPVSIADREHFRVHVPRDSGELYVGKPVRERVSNAWTVQLTRRVNKPDGSFGGVVAVGVATSYFSNYYQRLDLGAGGSVALVGRDGIVRARQAGKDEAPGQDVSSSALLALGETHSEGSFFSPFRIDSVPRYVSFRALPDYPLLVLVGRAANEVLAPAAASERLHLSGAAIATLLLLAFCGALAHNFARDHDAMRRRARLRGERERAFGALQESEARYRRLLETMPNAVVTTQRGIIQYANPAAVLLFGATTPADLLGRASMDFIHPDSHEEGAMRSAVLNREATHFPLWELRLVRHDGSEFDAELSAVSFAVGGGLVVQNIIRDISARKRAEADLRESEARFRSLTELSSDFYWESDEQHRFVRRVGSPQELQPFPIEPSIGRTRWELPVANPGSAGWEAHRADLDARRPFYNLEIQRPVPGGADRWLSVSGEPIFSAQGVFRGYRGIGRNITRRKHAELKLQQLNADLEQRVAERTAQLELANRDLESFSYSVAHDLRAPLRAIDGFAALLELHLQGRLDDEGRRLLARVRTGALRMAALIEALLEFARSARSEMKVGEADLRVIAESVAAGIGPQYPNARISIGALPLVRGDATLLREVLENLVGNALKYSSKVAEPRIELGSLRTAQGIAFFVRDNGAGFDPSYAEHLFGPFRRLHSEAEFPGTGIGLALCRRIVERHGGRIWAESSPGRGATFFFSLAPAAM